MPRPSCCRKIHALPAAGRFVPEGVPRCHLEAVTLSVDEFEALRLADLEGLYQEGAAQRMGVSRPTFGRIIESARRKVAEALVQAKALNIEGGAFVLSAGQTFECRACRHTWQGAGDAPSPGQCPKCHNPDLHRADAEEESCCQRGEHAKTCQRHRCCKTKGQGEEQ